MRSSNCKIIHVEDNQDECDIFQFLLKKLRINIELTQFYDGETALNFLSSKISSNQANEHFLLLLDLNLPRKTGLEILQYLHDSHNKNRISVIIFSGSDSPEDKRNCLDLGAMEYFVKPWRINAYEDFIKGPLYRCLQKVCPDTFSPCDVSGPCIVP